MRCARFTCSCCLISEKSRFGGVLAHKSTMNNGVAMLLRAIKPGGDK